MIGQETVRETIEIGIRKSIEEIGQGHIREIDKEIIEIVTQTVIEIENGDTIDSEMIDDVMSDLIEEEKIIILIGRSTGKMRLVPRTTSALISNSSTPNFKSKKLWTR